MNLYKFTYWYVLLVLLSLESCHQKKDTLGEGEWDEIPLKFANGFTIKQKEGATLVEVLEAFPKSHRSYRYMVIDESSSADSTGYDAVIRLPIKNVVLTSTTQIPHLDLLHGTNLLAGFPNLDLISSELVRSRINQNAIVELGTGPAPNMEKILDLSPDWVMLSTLGNDLAQLDIYKRTGIPAILNGDYVEKHPLGMAEWIKVTGALIGKLDEAIAQFDQIASAYHEAEKLVNESQLEHKPTVMTGVMYQDIWYAPAAESWASVLLQAAGADYLFKSEPGKGSLSLNYEFVLDRAMDAELWIGAADHTSLQSIKSSDKRYTLFRPFLEKNIYTYTNKRGGKGGLLYFEQGYVRPDLVLKDLIKIIHPHLLPDYELYFYKRLDEK